MSSIAKFIHKYKRELFIAVLLSLVAAAAFMLRIFGTAWDQEHFLHPDERFLYMVESALKLPKDLWQYFDPRTSPLNPYRMGHAFFVYGHFPLTLAKILSVMLGYDDYSKYYLVARPLTALADVSVVVAVYLVARRFVRKGRLPLYASLVYAVLVFPIQQAHFFTTDSFVNAFFVWSLYFALGGHAIGSGVMAGLGLASKLSFIYTLPLMPAVLFLGRKKWPDRVLKNVLFFVAAYLSLRVFDPYIFHDASFLNPALDPQFIDNLRQLSAMGSGDAFYPPAVQWLSKGFFFPLMNIFFFGTGPAFFLLAITGLILVLSKKWKDPLILAILLWAGLFFVYQSLQFAKTMRYFIFLYPLLASLAAVPLSLVRNRPVRLMLFAAGIIWTIGFLHIYTVPHSRVQASRWIYAHLPHNSVIFWEYWDDPLPLRVSDVKSYRFLPENLYAPDTEQKWAMIAKKLRHADYIVLSSNRLWGSITEVPELYPVTSRYYDLLFSERLGFRELKVFTSYPTLNFLGLRLELVDDWAEEAFTVYDHPKVIIFEKDRTAFSEQRFLREILHE